MNSIWNTIKKSPFILLRYRPALLIKLITIYLLCPVLIRLVPIYVFIYKVLYVSASKITASYRIRRWQRIKDRLIDTQSVCSDIHIDKLGLNPNDLNRIKQHHQQTHEVIIADIDQDGFWKSLYGPIENTPAVSADDFLPRTRFFLHVVSLNGFVGIKKIYCGNKLAFLNELQILHKLNKIHCHYMRFIIQLKCHL